jgi:hypothetical protein
MRASFFPAKLATNSGQDVGLGRVARFRRLVLIFGLAAGLHLLAITRAEAQDHADFRYETYNEGNGRIGVETQSGLVEAKLTPWLSLKAEFVYDAISGATPTGAPPPDKINFVNLNGPGPIPGQFSDKVPTVEMRDIRTAGTFDPIFSFGPNRITPEFSYSEEHDYVSYGAALNYSLDLNNKNTTLNAGWSHDWDRVLPYTGTYINDAQGKDADEFLLGVNQLLGPKTVLTVNAIFGAAQGYLSDPYRGVLFTGYPQFDPASISLAAENRPRHRETYAGFASLNHFITPLDGAAEVSYRQYYDSYGIAAETVAAVWRQKIGNRATISPEFRYYRQTAADFYATEFAGSPFAPAFNYYSSDYRLSEMQTVSFGVNLEVKVVERFSVNLGYKRYIENGLDQATSSSAYPSANIITLGARLWF